MRRHENETDEVELELIQRSWYFFFLFGKSKTKYGGRAMHKNLDNLKH